MPKTRLIDIGYGVWLHVRKKVNSKHNWPHCHAIKGRGNNMEGAATISLKDYKNIKAGEILKSFGFSKKMLRYITRQTLYYLDELIDTWEDYNNDR